MLKRIQDWIFKEELEELEIEEKNEYEEEEIAFAKAPVIKEEKRRVESIFEGPVEPIVRTSPPKMNIDIKVDDPIVEKRVAEKRPEKVGSTLIRRDEYEMPPVISPYFGVKGESVHKKENSAQNQFSSYDNKKETFNSVISPFYGKTESQKPIQETRAEPLPIFNEGKSEVIIENKMIETASEDEENLSLDEIVSSNSENVDDLIQFSLFGENKRIQEDEFENEDAENTDVLPF